MLKAKQLGLSDAYIAKRINQKPSAVRQMRKDYQVLPVVKQIDTLAAECDAQTNYLYLSYHGQFHDIEPSANKSMVVLGSGPYSIGSSVEFDWCAVTTTRTLQQQGIDAIMINANPETVSTDYDESERLYFEQLSLERVLDIAEFENHQGIVVSVGGQIANNLALPLEQAGQKILGTKPCDIKRNKW